MQRRVIKLCVRIVLQIEHLQRELATGDRNRPPAGNPSLIKPLAQLLPLPGRYARAIHHVVSEASDTQRHLSWIGNIPAEMRAALMSPRLRQAVATLTKRYHSADPAAWRVGSTCPSGHTPPTCFQIQFITAGAIDTPPIHVEIDPATGPPVNGSDVVFAAVAAAVWLDRGCPPDWPVR